MKGKLNAKGILKNTQILKKKFKKQKSQRLVGNATAEEDNYLRDIYIDPD